MTRGPLTLCCSLMLAACGGASPAGAVWLRIEAPLVVPTDCDAVRIQARRGQVGSSEPLLDKTWDLGRGPSFPLELSLVEDDRADLAEGPLRVTVQALNDGVLARPWSERAVEIRLTEGQIVERTIELCDCEAAP